MNNQTIIGISSYQNSQLLFVMNVTPIVEVFITF